MNKKQIQKLIDDLQNPNDRKIQVIKALEKHLKTDDLSDIPDIDMSYKLMGIDNPCPTHIIIESDD